MKYYSRHKNWTREGEREFYRQMYEKDLSDSPITELEFAKRKLKQVQRKIDACAASMPEHVDQLNSIKEANYEIHKEFLAQRISEISKQPIAELNSSCKQVLNGNLEILRIVEPPIISHKNEYLLGSRSKGAITAFIDALKQKGLIASKVSDAELALAMNELIVGLNLGKDGRTLRNRSSAYLKYYNKLLNLLE